MRVLLVALLALAMPGHAQSMRYTLTPQAVADDVFVFRGADEDFSRANGGNIVNTGFIVAPEGVIVIDSGPSHRYGMAQRAAILAATGRDVVLVLITHLHPDHMLGSTAYADVPIRALPTTAVQIESGGAQLAENLYRLLGGWMSGSMAVAPAPLASVGMLELAGRRLNLLAMRGHSAADLAVLDDASGVLFAGDLVFLDRAPTTAHADLTRWKATLDAMEKLDARVIVPGHGLVHGDTRGIAQTRDYLDWLATTLDEAAGRGLSMNEVMALPAPERIASLPVFASEFARSVVHLYARVEERSLRASPPMRQAKD